MSTRAEQREQTRERIIEAAATAFSELGFHASSTREIAKRAGVNQGLITYHFRSKEHLWRASVDRIFSLLRTRLDLVALGDASGDARERARDAIRRYVRFVAAHPEFFRLMVEEGRTADDRMLWLVETHLKPLYAAFERLQNRYAPETDAGMSPHAFYALAGAASLMFAVAPECSRLTGLNPARKQTIETHAEYVSRLFIR